jgi:hypothetical protein
MYDVHVVSLQGILEGSQETWKESVGPYLNRQADQGWDIAQMFPVGENLVIVWQLKAKKVTG